MQYQEDPNMQFTEWDSMSKTVSTEKIKLIEVDNNKLKTVSSGQYYYIIFPLVILVSFTGLLIAIDAVSEFTINDYFKFVLFLCFVSGVLYLFFNKWSKNILFDFINMKYLINAKVEGDLNNIKAIQVLTHHHSNSGNYKIRFELNIVKASGERIHLFNNSNYEMVIKQAELLAQKLNVIVWDAS